MDPDDSPRSEEERQIHASMPQALHILRKEYVQKGKKELYESLLRIGFGQRKYDEIGNQLGVSKNTAAVMVFRFRHRLTELIRKIIKDNSRDEGSSGSALLPVPKHPLTPHGSTGAERVLE